MVLGGDTGAKGQLFHPPLGPIKQEDYSEAGARFCGADKGRRRHELHFGGFGGVEGVDSDTGTRVDGETSRILEE